MSGMVLLLLHAAATVYMAAIAWFVQIVHYPLMHRVGLTRFQEYERGHARRSSLVVTPVMLFELVTGAWLALDPPEAIGEPPMLLNAALLAVLWLSTLGVQRRLHRALAGGYDEGKVNRLVATSWIRTVGWTLRAVLLLTLLVIFAEGLGAGG